MGYNVREGLERVPLAFSHLLSLAFPYLRYPWSTLFYEAFPIQPTLAVSLKFLHSYFSIF